MWPSGHRIDNDPTVLEGRRVTSELTRIAFVCVRNAGRSQMAHAFAERELADRHLEDVELVSGGTDPADAVHDVVTEANTEVGIDLADRTPREITTVELADCDVVITMGCSAGDVCPATWTGDGRDWALENPDDREPAAVRSVRDEIESKVGALFDELAAEADRPPDS